MSNSVSGTHGYLRLAAIAVTLTVAACGSQPPQSDIDAARVAYEKAASASDGQYATPAFERAQAARRALDAELRLQDMRWLKSYDKSRTLAKVARDEAEQAATDARTEREQHQTASVTTSSSAATRPAPSRRKKADRLEQPVKIKDVQPVYPAVARAARVSGRVTIDATVDATGKVSVAKVVNSVPLLDAAALDAVKRWSTPITP